MKNKFLTTLFIGCSAGVVDIIPGIMRGVDMAITLAGFTFWLVATFVISYLTLAIRSWKKGIVVSVGLSLPGLFLFSLFDPATIIPMLGLTVVLGGVVGFLTDRYPRPLG